MTRESFTLTRLTQVSDNSSVLLRSPHDKNTCIAIIMPQPINGSFKISALDKYLNGLGAKPENNKVSTNEELVLHVVGDFPERTPSGSKMNAVKPISPKYELSNPIYGVGSINGAFTMKQTLELRNYVYFRVSEKVR